MSQNNILKRSSPEIFEKKDAALLEQAGKKIKAGPS